MYNTLKPSLVTTLKTTFRCRALHFTSSKTTSSGRSTSKRTDNDHVKDSSMYKFINLQFKMFHQEASVETIKLIFRIFPTEENT